MSQLEEIQRLREMIRNGVTTVVVDGQTVSINLEEVKRQLRQLEIEAGLRTRSPRVARVVTGNR